MAQQKFPANGLTLSETVEQLEPITGTLEEGKSFVQQIERDGKVKADHHYTAKNGQIRVHLFTVNGKVRYYHISSLDGEFGYSSI